MQKLLFLDCDGTIREPLSGAKFIQHPRDQKIIPGADKAISHYHKLGWQIIGISNQGGVPAGYKSLEDAIWEQLYTLDLFPQIEEILFCADFEGIDCWQVDREFGYFCQKPPLSVHPDEDDWGDAEFKLFPEPIPQTWEGSFRKPGPGMIQLAIAKYGDYFPPYKYNQRPDLHLHWLVGDRSEDQQAAAAAGINFCPADVWRDRFLTGISNHPVSNAQLEFLENIKL